jgi:hypothetical protein
VKKATKHLWSWIAAFLLVVAVLVAFLCEFGTTLGLRPVLVVLLAAVCSAISQGIASLWTQRKQRREAAEQLTLENRREQRQDPDDAIEAAATLLKNAVDNYCEQREARCREYPWLLASFSIYCGIFVVHIMMMARSGGSSSFVLGAILATVAMIMAGCSAHEDPAKEGAKPLFDFLKGYEPQSTHAYIAFRARVSDGSWTMQDLIDFAAEEKRLADLRMSARFFT